MLTEPEVRQLLAVVMAYDNRKPGDAMVLAWSEAARRGRWTLGAALNAVHEHYARNTTWLMPGHITEAIRADERHPPPIRDQQASGQLPSGFEFRSIPASAEPAFDPPIDPAAKPNPEPLPRPFSRWTRRARQPRLDAELRAQIEAELNAKRPPQADTGEAAS